ncbi:MAG: hypothetical protein JXA20_18275 [Spirochaetes bacterium]|nr:hypothetical protein [Spirochaetota bacterium]
MNVKRFIIASLVIFAVFQVTGFIIHSVILMPTYAALASLWRPDMMSYMWIMYPVSLVMSFLMVYIFAKGYEGKGIPEGLRFGLVIGLFMQVPGIFGQFMVYPIPFTLAIQWFIYGLMEYLIAGVLAAAIYRPK